MTALSELRDETLRLTAFGRPPRDVMVRICAWRPAERVARTLAGWLGCWALASITLFIPVAHVLLVPGFVIAGIVLLLRRSREDQSFVDGRGACPACGMEQTFRLRGKVVLPKQAACPACRARLLVEALAP